MILGRLSLYRQLITLACLRGTLLRALVARPPFPLPVQAPPHPWRRGTALDNSGHRCLSRLWAGSPVPPTTATGATAASSFEADSLEKLRQLELELEGEGGKPGGDPTADDPNGVDLQLDLEREHAHLKRQHETVAEIRSQLRYHTNDARLRRNVGLQIASAEAVLERAMAALKKREAEGLDAGIFTKFKKPRSEKGALSFSFLQVGLEAVAWWWEGRRARAEGGGRGLSRLLCYLVYSHSPCIHHGH